MITIYHRKLPERTHHLSAQVSNHITKQENVLQKKMGGKYYKMSPCHLYVWAANTNFIIQEDIGINEGTPNMES